MRNCQKLSKTCQKLSEKRPETEWKTAKNWVRNGQKLSEKLPKSEWETANIKYETENIYRGQNNTIIYRYKKTVITVETVFTVVIVVKIVIVTTEATYLTAVKELL